MNVVVEAAPGRDERVQFGVGCRGKMPRVDQGDWSGKDRRFAPVELLLAANRGRLRHLLPIKWARMAASPFGFFRGALPLMVADIARTPSTGLHVQLCGDAHLCNLGAYAAPDGRLIFDVNDFDEATFGPWEWDVKRFAVSVILAGRQAGNSEKANKAAVLAFLRSYRDALFQLAKLTLLDLFRFQVRRHMNAAPILSVLRKAERSTPELSLRTLTHLSGSKREFLEKKPLLQRVIGAKRREVLGSLREYRDTLSAERQHFFDQYTAVDVSFKVVGTGSVGVHDYIVLFLGNGPEDALFLQIKEELPSAWTKAHVHGNGRTVDATFHQGRRVVDGQRRMQAQSDPFLGWTTMGGREYLVRQLADHKAAIDPAEMRDGHLIDYAVVCGEVLAKGHARSGDACALSGYCGRSEKLDKAIAKFAVTYADQTTADYRAFLAATKHGKIKCDPAVAK